MAPKIDSYYLSDEQREARRRRRIDEMRRKKQQQEIIRRFMIPIAAVAIVCIVGLFSGVRAIITGISSRAYGGNEQQISLGNTSSQETDIQEESTQEDTQQTQTEPNDIAVNASINLVGSSIYEYTAGFAEQQLEDFRANYISPLGGLINIQPPLTASATDATESFGADIISEYGILIDVGEGTIIAQRDSRARISPASMTKILTVLVAAEHVSDLEDRFTMTMDITNYCFVNDCSIVGFEVGEEITIRDLFYGTILPSGADAAVGLAVYVAGSHEAFVDMMNEKLDELGLSDTTHFTNCVGLYDDNHYSTAYDIAVILKAAADNFFCREVLSEHIYRTSATAQHPEGIEMSNLFLRRIEDQDTHCEVLYAKTGYITESGSCAASFSVDSSGKKYICVTAKSTSSWRCIYDQAALYARYF